MVARLVSKVLWKRRRLRRRDHWTHGQLEEHQDRSFCLLRGHAYARSPFYQRFHAGLTDRPLDELPILTKATLMEHFDELVTDPSVRLADVEAHLATLRKDELFDERYRVASTSGTNLPGSAHPCTAPGCRRCAWTRVTRWRASSSASTASDRRCWWPTPRWSSSWLKSNWPDVCGSPPVSSSAPRRF